MSRYDLSRASDRALIAVARAALGYPTSRSLPLDNTTRRCVEAVASVLLDEPEETFYELQALRAECRLKTRSEYDREIGDILRNGSYLGAAELMRLIEASRSAPEDAP